VALEPFANEPILELRRAPVRARLADALRAHDARGPLRVPVWIGADRRDAEELVSTDPGEPERVVTDNAFGYVHNRSLRELLAAHGIRHSAPGAASRRPMENRALPPDAQGASGDSA
jgi:hypothetical protein